MPCLRQPKSTGQRISDLLVHCDAEREACLADADDFTISGTLGKRWGQLHLQRASEDVTFRARTDHGRRNRKSRRRRGRCAAPDDRSHYAIYHLPEQCHADDGHFRDEGLERRHVRLMNSLRKLKTPLLIMICCLLGVGAGAGNVSAESASDSYIYSYWGDAAAAPAAYVATDLISGSDLGTGAFQEPSDLHVAADNRVYVLDSGNNRIVVLDHDLKLVTTVDSFTREGEPDTFLQPQGIFVTDDGEVLVADTGNKRVVHLDSDFQLIKIIDSPESELLQDSFKFEPVRVVMDHAREFMSCLPACLTGSWNSTPKGRLLPSSARIAFISIRSNISGSKSRPRRAARWSCLRLRSLRIWILTRKGSSMPRTGTSGE